MMASRFDAALCLLNLRVVVVVVVIVLVILGSSDLTISLIADSGIDLEKPSPLHVLVGVRTSGFSIFLPIAGEKENKNTVGARDYG